MFSIKKHLLLTTLILLFTPRLTVQLGPATSSLSFTRKPRNKQVPETVFIHSNKQNNKISNNRNTVSKSTPQNEQNNSILGIMDTKSSSFRLILLTCMVLQNASVVLVGRYTRASTSKEDSYVINHLIIVTEFLKLVFSCFLESNATQGKLMTSIKENIIDVPLDAFKVTIPSLLYLLQNSLLYVALSNLSAPLFQVTYQSKLLTTAIVSVIMLKRSYSLKQWICLTMLGVGVAVVVLAESGSKNTQVTDAASQSLFVGLVAVTVSCLSSALAGVYFEMVLKKPTTVKGKEVKPVSLWMRNIQLAFFSVVVALVNQWRLTGDDANKTFLHGFNSWVWIVTLLQAGGGLLVAAIMKHADNVLKGLATGVSVVVSTIGSMVLFGTPLTFQFFVGAVVILTSVYFFTNDIPSWCLAKKEKVGDDLELQKLIA